MNTNGIKLKLTVGNVITIIILIITLTITLSSKADKGEFSKLKERVIVTEGYKDDLHRMEKKIDKIYDMMIEKK